MCLKHQEFFGLGITDCIYIGSCSFRSISLSYRVFIGSRNMLINVPATEATVDGEEGGTLLNRLPVFCCKLRFNYIPRKLLKAACSNFSARQYRIACSASVSMPFHDSESACCKTAIIVTANSKRFALIIRDFELTKVERKLILTLHSYSHHFSLWIFFQSSIGATVFYERQNFKIF